LQKANGSRKSITIIAFLALSIGIFLAFQYYALGADSSDFVQDKLSRMKLEDIWYEVLYLHIGTAVVAICIGWTQFVGKLRRKSPALHQGVGLLYTVCVGLSGIAGGYLSFYATGGWVSGAGFFLLSLAWLYTLIQGVRTIVVQRDVRAHREWMIRNYALTFAAVTLRIYVPASTEIFGPDNFEACYRIIAWLCWVPNLIFAEWLLRNRKAVSAPSSR
jgi:hypothetical protein